MTWLLNILERLHRSWTTAYNQSHHSPQGRRETFAEVSRAMNRIADMWERDGSDPCRVRITREYANAYRLYAEGLGEPTGSAKERTR